MIEYYIVTDGTGLSYDMRYRLSLAFDMVARYMQLGLSEVKALEAVAELIKDTPTREAK